MKSEINMCTYKSCQIGSSWMELQVQRNSPSASSPSAPFSPPLSPSPSPSSVLSWVSGASNIKGGGVETEGRDCKGNELESLAVKFLEAWHYTHWLITMFTYHTSLSSLKLCTAYNTVPFPGKCGCWLEGLELESWFACVIISVDYGWFLYLTIFSQNPSCCGSVSWWHCNHHSLSGEWHASYPAIRCIVGPACSSPVSRSKTTSPCADWVDGALQLLAMVVSLGGDMGWV